MKKLIKIVPIILMIVVIASAFLPVFAEVTPSDFSGNTQGTDSIKSLGNRIVGIVQVIGNVFSVIMLIVIGIHYLLGSAEEKAEYKKTMIPYLIGAIMIFAAANLAKVIYNFAHSINA